MTVFNAEVVGAKGVESLVIQAETRGEALAFAERYGVVTRLHREFELPKRLTSHERGILLRKLASLIVSKVGMGAALRLIAHEFEGQIRRVAEALRERIEAGADLPDAMLSLPKDFPRAVIALVQAGMRAGGSATALEAAAAFEEEMHLLRKVATSGMASALVGFVSALAVVVGSTYWLGPQMSQQITAMAGAGNDGIAFWVMVGNLLTYFLIGLAVGLVGLYGISTIGRKLAPHWADRITNSIPGWRTVRLGKEVFLGFYSLAALIRAGLPMEKALRLTADSLPPGRLASQTEEAWARVTEGQAWVHAFTDLGATDRAALAGVQDRQQAALVLGQLASDMRRAFIGATETFVMSLQLISALALTLGGGLMFAVSVLPMLQSASKIMTGV